jgi:hypothetical protein
MDDAERAELVGYLAYHPAAGVLIAGAGGVRKLRWGLEGRGKRGGMRVIYYYHGAEMPLYLMTAYAKNTRENLSRAEINTLQKIAQALVEMNRKRRASL